MSTKRPMKDVHLNSFASLFGEEDNEQMENMNISKDSIREIPIEDLVSFRNHTFRVDTTAESFRELVDSIKQNGKILNPVLVRPTNGNKYEIISGHRRTTAARELDFKTVPCIIKDFTDDEATVVMVDSNIQREDILPSEKARSYKAKFDALRGMRDQMENDEKTGEKSADILAESADESSRTIQRYISLTKLIPELMDSVDTGLIKTSTAYDLTGLTEEEQHVLYDYMNDTCSKISGKQARELKEAEHPISRNTVRSILSPKRKPKKEFAVKEKDLIDIVPETMDGEKLKNITLSLLKDYFKKEEM